MTRQEKIKALIYKTNQDGEFRSRFLNDPVGVATGMGLTLTPDEEGRASLMQADIWTGRLDTNAPIDRVFFGTPVTRPAPRPTEPEIDPYVRREPWRRTR